MSLAPPLLQRITQLHAERDRMQTAMLDADFGYLDNFFKAVESRTAASGGENHPDCKYFFSFHLLVDTSALPDPQEQLSLFQSIWLKPPALAGDFDFNLLIHARL